MMEKFTNIYTVAMHNIEILQITIILKTQQVGNKKPSENYEAKPVTCQRLIQ